MSQEKLAENMTCARPIDWYDGPVSALVRTTSRRSALLAVLLASVQTHAPPDYRTRIYGMFDISDDDELLLVRLLQGPRDYDEQRWQEIELAVRRMVATARGELLLFRGPDLQTGPIAEWASVPLEGFRQKLIWNADLAYKPETCRFWLDAFERALPNPDKEAR